MLQEQKLRRKAAGGCLTEGKANLQRARARHRAAPEEEEEQKQGRRQLSSGASPVRLTRGFILLAAL